MTLQKWEVVDRIVDRMPWTDDYAIDAALLIYNEVVVPAIADALRECEAKRDAYHEAFRILKEIDLPNHSLGGLHEGKR